MNLTQPKTKATSTDMVCCWSKQTALNGKLPWFARTRVGSMPKLKSGTIIPTLDETVAIDAGIASDSDARELEAEWFSQAKPASEAFAPETYTALVAMKRPRGRPKADETKVFTAIRLDADLLEAFKATGKGWQTRVNAALRQYIAEHPIIR
nr:BrnA antitoxin family protein [Ferrovum sp.]